MGKNSFTRFLVTPLPVTPLRVLLTTLIALINYYTYNVLTSYILKQNIFLLLTLLTTLVILTYVLVLFTVLTPTLLALHTLPFFVPRPSKTKRVVCV